VLDDSRRHQAFQLAEFPGLRDYYAASDAHLVAQQGRSVVGATPPGYRPHQALRLTLPEPARAAAARRMDGDGPWLALMPAGAAERALYPSVASWELVLDALREALPGLRVALVGRLQRDRGSSTALDAAEMADLLAHDTVALDAFDADFAEQRA
jgi:hypothetical protein